MSLHEDFIGQQFLEEKFVAPNQIFFSNNVIVKIADKDDHYSLSFFGGGSSMMLEVGGGRMLYLR